MKRLGPSIFGRVVISFLLLVALPTLGLLAILSQTAVRSLYEASASQARETGDQILRAINQEADMVSYQAGALLNDPDLTANVGRYTAASGPGQSLAATQIDRNLIGFFNLTNKAGTIAVLTRGAGWYSYGNLSNPAALATEAADLVREAEASPGRVVFQDDIANYAFTAAIAPGIGEQDSPVRALVLRMRAAVFFGLSFSGGIADRTDVVLRGRTGQVLFSTLPKTTLAALVSDPDTTLGDRTRRLGDAVWLTSTQGVESTGWRLVTLRNEASLTARFRVYEQAILVGLLVLLALFGTYAWQVFARIAAPIHHVVHSMDRVAQGDWGFHIPNPGLRDLDVLVDGFNRMSGEIVRLNRERLTVELEALRHQINPHFLANTLNVVKLMAASARMRSIEQLTADLMVLLSDSYQGGTSLTDVASEVRNIESYVRIMKVRFNTGFDLLVSADPDALSAQTPRMLLQPLVENAILHGLTGLARPGRIDLRVRIEEDRLVFEVEDNGRGMPEASTPPPPDKSSPDRLGRIGLDNVTRRLELTFGAAGRLEVESQPDTFTRVRISLPLLRGPANA